MTALAGSLLIVTPAIPNNTLNANPTTAIDLGCGIVVSSSLI